MRFSAASVVAILAYTASAQIGDAVNSAINNGATDLGNVGDAITSAVGGAVTGDAGAVFSSVTSRVGDAVNTGRSHPRHLQIPPKCKSNKYNQVSPPEVPDSHL